MGYVAIAIWAYLQLTAGVNLFRRALGLAGLVYIVVVISQRFGASPPWPTVPPVETRRARIGAGNEKGPPERALREAGVTGLEPAASGLTVLRSNQLSYTPGLLRASHGR